MPGEAVRCGRRRFLLPLRRKGAAPVSSFALLFLVRRLPRRARLLQDSTAGARQQPPAGSPAALRRRNQVAARSLRALRGHPPLCPAQLGGHRALRGFRPNQQADLVQPRPQAERPRRRAARGDVPDLGHLGRPGPHALRRISGRLHALHD